MRPEMLKTKAISLRKSGYSIKQIARLLGIGVGTSSVWLSGIELKLSAKKRIDRRSTEARQRGALERKRRLNIGYRIVERIVSESLENLKFDRLTKRLLCSFLYWGEGAKTGVTIKFTNSDPVLISTFLGLFRESFKINELRLSATLHLHSYHNERKQLLFWAKITKIPIHRIHIYRKINSGKRTKDGYPGCITINYSNSRLFVALTSHYKFFNLAGLV